MHDAQQRDQFLIRHQNVTEIYWNDSPRPVCVNDGKSDEISSSLDTVTWTPLGSYLVTMHGRGLILRGGDNFNQISRLPHQNVCAFSFSSGERYAVTWNGQMGVTNRDAVCI